ncbi:MAG: ABC transporter ATP-binding protein/permease [Spirochaetaceae bacterium]|jgi:ABC-type multidrug transport system fused ATPase/permease subunit|nr:ABC transporter ATP-binding protein/permease [Spirochaetaceae bacterium]
MKQFFEVLRLLKRKDKLKLIPIVISILISSFLELAQVAALGPFMSIITDNSIIHSNSILSYVYNLCGFSTDRAFLVFVGIGIFLFIIIGAAFRMFVSYMRHRYIRNRDCQLKIRLLRQYMAQPYAFFLDHNSGDLSKSILTEASYITDMLYEYLVLATSLIISAGIIVYLFILNTPTAFISLFLFFFIYIVLNRIVRKKVDAYGKELGTANSLAYRSVNEAFGGIKDIRILGKEKYFVDMYGRAARKSVQISNARNIFTDLPSQLIQSLAIGVIILMTLFMLSDNQINNILPTLSMFSFAVMKLIPNAQTLFRGFVSLRFYQHIFNQLYKEYESLPKTALPFGKNYTYDMTKMPFKSNIVLNNIQFQYVRSKNLVLQDINLKIEKNTTIGLAGTTGCGKTTLVDLLMGLLTPVSGEILVDGKKLDAENINDWQHNFGYVPQQIYLCDDSIAANIAFGIAPEDRDLNLIQEVAKMANMHDFIINELSQGYDTYVGERGIRLSGGQRQRLGIARALYNNPSILVMDEATSALDSATEDAVMDAIHNLAGSVTMILIAHRITTIQEADVIYLMEGGRVVEQGTYDELLKTSDKFRTLAKVK